MKILGIETSCDETAAAVVEDGVKIFSNVVASSIELHKKTGGIIPERAAREQIKCVIPVIDEALGDITPDKIDAIAVTVGPGLIGSLLVGVETAKTLACVWKKPIIPVNHLVGHIYANFIGENQKSKIKNQKYNSKLKNIKFPAMVLIVSGGHTELVLMEGHGRFKFVGGTRDDAAGEAFDKVARILGLPYPGGPSIEKESNKLACNTLTRNFKLPRPMIDSGDFDFSFSGLKTAVLRLLKDINIDSGSRPPKADLSGMTQKEIIISAIAYETQEAITDVLVDKTIRAAEYYRVKSILLAGGVAANLRLREKMEKVVEKEGRKFILSIPSSYLCTDNAANISSAAFFNYSPVPLKKIVAEPGLEVG